MVLTREQKGQLIEDLVNRFLKAQSVVLVNYRGLKVGQIQELRRKLREKGIDFKVVKNTLLKLALAKSKLEIDQDLFKKPMALAFDYQDEIQPCKNLYEFSKTNEALEILGGVIDGQFISLEKVKSLASLPSREELYAKIVGSCAAPISGFVNVLAGNLRNLISVLRQYQERIS